MRTADLLEEKALAVLLRIRRALSTHRKPIAYTALVAFVVGFAISAKSLNVDMAAVDIKSILVVALLLAPTTNILSAIGLQLSGRAINSNIDFRTALFVTSAGEIADILPIPASALARTAALVQAGATLRDGTLVVVTTAVLWIGLAIVLAGLSVRSSFVMTGSGAVLIGLTLSLGSLVWISRRTTAKIVSLIVAHRVANLILAVLRLQMVFAGISIAVSLEQSALIVLAIIVGSASSLAPAGLGVSESIAAALSGMVAVTASAAFLAVAVNRVIGLLVSACVSFALGSKYSSDANGG